MELAIPKRFVSQAKRKNFLEYLFRICKSGFWKSGKVSFFHFQYLTPELKI